MKRARSFAAVLAATLLALAPAAPARAQMVVIDPAVLAQNIIEVARALEQIHNQIRQIEQQAAMLAQNPLDLSPELTQSIEEARGLLEAAEGLSFQSDALSEELRKLYPETFEAFNLDDIGAQTERWLAADRAAVEQAMAHQSRAVRSLGDTSARVDRALASSTDAEGQTSAIQASNQLLAITASQLAEMQALMAAQGRALDVERMERITREERARDVQRRAFPTSSSSMAPTAGRAF